MAKLAGLVGRKTVYVDPLDPLDQASDLASSAVNLFTEAHDQLEESNSILRLEVEDSLAAVERAEARKRAAEAQLASNGKVQEKLADFIV